MSGKLRTRRIVTHLETVQDCGCSWKNAQGAIPEQNRIADARMQQENVKGAIPEKQHNIADVPIASAQSVSA